MVSDAGMQSSGTQCQILWSRGQLLRKLDLASHSLMDSSIMCCLSKLS